MSLVDQVRRLLSSREGASEDNLNLLLKEVVDYHLGKVEEMVLADLVGAGIPQAGVYNARNTLLHKAIDRKKTFLEELERKGCRKFGSDPVVQYLVGPNDLREGARRLDEAVKMGYHDK